MSNANPQRRDWDGNPVLRHTKDGSHVKAAQAMNQRRGNPERNRSGQIIDSSGRPVQRHVKTPPSAGGNAPLRAEKRMDSTGKLVTRWVKDTDTSSPASEALSNNSAFGTTGVPNNVDWNSASPDKVRKLVDNAAEGLDDPARVWNNFDFYTNLLDSDHTDIALIAVGRDRPIERLRDAWLNMHGAKLEQPSAYRTIGGDEGYDAYKDAYYHFSLAAEAAKIRWADSPQGLQESPVGSGGYGDEIRQEHGEIIEKMHEAEARGESFDIKPHLTNISSEPKAPKPFMQVMKEAKAREASKSTSPGNGGNESGGGAVGQDREETFAERQERETKEYYIEQTAKRVRALQGDVPASSDSDDAGGKPFEWSSLNPFKRRK